MDSDLKIIRSNQDDNIAIVTLKGDFDVYCSQGVRNALLGVLQDDRNLIVDLTQLTFIDSTGLGILIGTYKKYHDKQKFLIVCASAEISKVFKITGLDRIFKICATLDEALDAIKTPTIRVI